MTVRDAPRALSEAAPREAEASRTPEASYWHINLMAVVILLLVHVTITDRLHEDIRTFTRVLLFLAIVLLPRWPLSWTLWGTLAGLLGLQAALAPFDVPNHHYALTYLALAMTLALAGPEPAREDELRTGARWLLVAIMGLATLQKLASPAFMDGSYVGYVLATGGFARPLVVFCGACQSAIAANQEAVEAFRQTVPALEATVPLAPPLPHLAVAARGFLFSIVAMEGWLTVAFLAFPERRLAHWSLLLFAVTLGVLRQEFLFIGVVSLLGLLSCPRNLTWERRAYALAVVVFAAGAIS